MLRYELIETNEGLTVIEIPTAPRPRKLPANKPALSSIPAHSHPTKTPTKP